MVRKKEEAPNEEDRNSGDRESHCKPGSPADLGIHVTDSDEVLRGRYGRALTADVGCEGNCNLPSGSKRALRNEREREEPYDEAWCKV